jgi:hypothetical protein
VVWTIRLFVATFAAHTYNLLISGSLVYFFFTVQDCFRLKELQIVVNSKYGATMSQHGATKVAAESIKAQMNSHC